MVYSIENNPELLGMATLQRDIVYCNSSTGPLYLQLYQPWHKKDTAASCPLILFIQGSGFTHPDVTLQLAQLAFFARKGFAVASVTHRSAWEVPFPGGICDVKTAIRFLRANAARYGINPERIFVWGTSSGGNFAAMLGLTGDNPFFKTTDYPEYSDAVAGVIDFFGPVDFPLHLKYKHQMGMGTDTLRQYFGGLMDERKMQLASPLHYLQENIKCPPFLIMHGTGDSVVLPEQSELLYDALRKKGIESTLYLVENAEHERDFWSQQVLDIVLNFVNRHIQG